jgi:glutamine synthetase
VQAIIKEHKAVLFNGDGYSEEWHNEAAKRGLPNLKSTIDALPVLISPKNIEMFEKYGVLSAREVHSRYDIYMERYCKDINTESQAALSIAKTMILPAAYRYQGELASTAASLKAALGNADLTMLKTVTELVGELEKSIAGLEAAMGHHGGGDLAAEAKHFHSEVIPAMLAVRTVADKLETVVADDIWPLPTYREMLFIK